MRISAALGAAAATVLSAAIGAAPAAAQDEVGLSVDGRHWSDDLVRPLLDPRYRWVPGDSRLMSFYVRNDGSSEANLTIAVETRDADRLLADRDVALSARVAPGAWGPLDNGRDAALLLSGPMSRSGTVRVDLRVHFRWASTNASQVDRLPLDLVVRLTDAGLGTTGAGDGHGFLPGAGNVVESWLVLLGVVLLGGGAGLVLAARRVRHADG